MVDILLVLEKCQLLGFLWAFRNRTSYYHKAMFHFLLVVDFLPEFSHFPTIAQGMKPATSSFLFDVGIFFGYNYISTSSTVEKSDHSASIESRIHPKSNAGSCNGLWHFPQADPDKRDGSCGTRSVARSQTSMPEFLETRFETEQRMVRTPSTLFWTVSFSGSLLFPIDYNHDRIQIEGQCGSFQSRLSKKSMNAEARSFLRNR